MHHIKEVSKIVEDILNKDPMTRNNDRYLYLEVVRAVKPELLNVPFCIAYMDEGIPSTETVRRSRQKIQADNPHLAAEPQVEGMREIKKEEFFDYAISW